MNQLKINSEISDQDIFDNFEYYKNFPEESHQENKGMGCSDNNSSPSLGSDIKAVTYHNDGYSNICEYCNQNQLVLGQDGYYFCQNCSIVNDRLIDDGQEWRYYGHEDSKSVNPARCGLPTNNLYPEACLGSNISMDGQHSYQMRKIANYHRYSTVTYKVRNLYESLNIMTIYATNGGIAPCIIEEAKQMYWKIVKYRASHNLNEFRKPNREAILAASILEAAKTLNYHRSAEEIAQIFKIKKTAVIKGHKQFKEYWRIIQNLEENSKSAYGDEQYAKPSEPADYINRFCSKLGLDVNIQKICTDICYLIHEKNITPAYVPISIASGVIFLVNNIMDKGLSKPEISYACDNVSEATIDKCYQDLEKNLEDILPDYLVEILVKNIEATQQ